MDDEMGDEDATVVPAAETTFAPIDVFALCEPIDGPGGTGADLRFDPVYRAIQEARRADNASLPRGIWMRDTKRADWQAVERQCVDVLRSRSKDLQVACWLTEAVVHRTGFAGLASGVRLMTALCRRFWADLYPALDGEDVEPRVAPFEWLNARFPVLLRDQLIVCSALNPDKAYTWTNYANALLLEGLRQRDTASVARSEAAGAVTLAAFNAVRDQTDVAFWDANLAGLQDANAALAELNDTLEDLCGRDAPGLGAVSEAIRDIQNLTAGALAERRPKSFAAPPRSALRSAPDAAAPAPAAPREAASEPWVDGEVMTREEAYRRLTEIANALHHLEPHSPAPYLIRSAVSWADMSFAEVVASFSRAGLDIGKVFEVLGLNPIGDSRESLH